jgi:lysozyme family protein
MADFKNLIPFIRKEEGLLSKAQTDMARFHPVPDGSGYHTNKGVTWQTWSSVFGSDANSIKRFYAMSDADWESIYKKLYWDKINGDQINSQRIADTLLNWVWGAGLYTPVTIIQRLVNVKKPDGILGAETVRLINSAEESTLYKNLKDSSYNWFSKLGDNPKYSANKTGWLNRLSNLASYVEKGVSKTISTTKEKIKTNPIPSIVITTLLLVSIFAIYKTIKRNK